MTAFANVGKVDLLRRTIDMYVGQEIQGGYIVSQPGGLQFTVLNNAAEPPTDIKPTLSLPEDQARALLSALLKHFEGGDDLRQLRRDYDAERARVDKLLDKLTPFGLAPAGVVG